MCRGTAGAAAACPESLAGPLLPATPYAALVCKTNYSCVCNMLDIEFADVIKHTRSCTLSFLSALSTTSCRSGWISRISIAWSNTAPKIQTLKQ
jgi:hypothetical protein